jgi:Flp pilus assembly protein TadG
MRPTARSNAAATLRRLSPSRRSLRDLHRNHLSKPRNERGSATVFVIGFAIVLFLCAGLVIDGGLAINKRMRIADDAEQAARIGADSIDVNEFRRTETLVIDKQLARQRISGYMADLGYGSGNWSADIGGDQVGVEVNDTSKTYILNLFGVRFPVRASAEAVPDTGQPNPAP